MKKKLQAFTLAEALILLLIAALIAAALVPVITRKHREVGEHGKWICTINNDGKHVIKSVLRGKITQFQVAQNDGEYCLFAPPAAAKNFTIKAIGGGGGGGGGSAGDIETVFDSRTSGNMYAGVVENDGGFNIIMAGSGGGGGGMNCGQATTQSTTNLNLENNAIFEEQSSDHHGMYDVTKQDWSWNEGAQKHSNGSPISWCPKTSPIGYDVDCSKSENSKSEDPNYPKYYKYGYVDQQLNGFRYNLLFQNDQKYTDNPSLNYGKKNENARFTNERGEWAGEISVYDFKYKYIDYEKIGFPNGDNGKQMLQNRIMCFAEANWPLSKEVKGDKGLYLTDNDPNKPSIKCWNLPGMGGDAGEKESSINGEELRAGESIYVKVGEAGSGKNSNDSHKVDVFLPNESTGVLQLKKDKIVTGGTDGTAGEDTILQIGNRKIVAAGGAGGASRYLLELPSYVNIPVRECEVIPEEGQFLDEPTAAAHIDGQETTNPSFCTNTPHGTCSAGAFCKNYVYKTCTGTNEDGSTYTYDCSYCADTQQWYRCSCRKHVGINRYKLGSCVQRVRPRYFDSPDYNINICLYSIDIIEKLANDEKPAIPQGGKGGIMDLDFPYFNPEIKETTFSAGDSASYYLEGNRKRFEGAPGSGGYGAGELVRSYLKGPNVAIFNGEEGNKGYVSIVKSSAYGGTGGQAGQYVNTMVKKLAKLKITVGTSGGPSAPMEDGHPGKATIIQQYNKDKNDYEDMFVLQGGLAGQAKKLNKMATSSVVAGGDGVPSPIENESNRAKIVPRGGYSGNNYNYNGQTAAIANLWGAATMKNIAFGISNMQDLIINIIGGHPMDMTYGAGGGGGAGTKEGVEAGGGGGGTPGAVIIEW